MRCNSNLAVTQVLGYKNLRANYTKIQVRMKNPQLHYPSCDLQLPQWRKPKQNEILDEQRPGRTVAPAEE